MKCGNKNQGRIARETNESTYYFDDSAPATVTHQQWMENTSGNKVIAQGGPRLCGSDNDERVVLELEMTVDSKDILSADTLIRADHRSNLRKCLSIFFFSILVFFIKHHIYLQSI